MSKLLFNKAFSEHVNEDVSSEVRLPVTSIIFNKKIECKCIEIIQNGDSKILQSIYFIGVDWLVKNEIAVYVAPKINDAAQQTDFLKMLFSCLRHSDVAQHTTDLYEIKFDQPYIEIEQKQDLLTPLLILQFLQVVKAIVKKGLKKSYYKVSNNLNAKIKGKVLIAATLKQNIIKNKPTKTFCLYDEYGVNSIENRILKRTLVFVQKYLALFPDYLKLASPVINYCLPAFQVVDEINDLNTLKGVTYNPFYKEYKEALHISSLILKRFGYNIKEVTELNNKLVKVPPFWIDMSKLFELYVLGLLKDKYNNSIKFQYNNTTYGQPDFLFSTTNLKMIIDTKYKSLYQKNCFAPEDIRQISGYARDKGVLSAFGYITPEEQDKVVDCLIIYPDQAASENLADNLKENEINGFTRFYKMAIKLPVISM